MAAGNQEGFGTEGPTATFKHNRATNNVDGFSIYGEANTFKRNTAAGNSAMGFNVVKGNNTFLRNRAGGNGAVDLSDANAQCDHNIWQDNLFGTSQVAGGPNPGCVQ